MRRCSSGDSGIAPRVEGRDSLRHPAGVTRRMTPPSGREASGRRGRRPLRRERNARAGRDAFIAPLPPALTFPSSLFPLPSSFLRQGSLQGKRTEKSRIFPQKSVDPEIWLCYTLFYLSDERFLFVRFFPRAGRSPAFQTGRQCSRNVSK